MNITLNDARADALLPQRMRDAIPIVKGSLTVQEAEAQLAPGGKVPPLGPTW